MRGEVIGVWSETWREIWSKLAKHPDAPEDLFCELYRELAAAFEPPPDVNALADIVDDPAQARKAFRTTKASKFRGEVALLGFFERAHGVVDDLGGDPLANRYFGLVEDFLEKFSLRYDLRRPCGLTPTLPGVFARLMRELKAVAMQDASLNALMLDFEEALRDIGMGATPGRMKTCLHKQFNFLEALTKAAPNVRSNTLGDMCREINTWPHSTVQQSAEKIYAFRGAYPGLGHGTGGGATREIEMRDLVAVSILLAGFAPYLTNLINSESIYSGS